MYQPESESNRLFPVRVRFGSIQTKPNRFSSVRFRSLVQNGVLKDKINAIQQKPGCSK
jgi:hypothetical protein